MKHVDSDSYSVAWFKLADCIARGEKERALGVFRLLSHSLDDSALSHQLYGDILRSFGDPRAVEKYKEAARIFKERKQMIEAAAICEHIAVLEPENVETRIELIELYQHLSIRSKVMDYVNALVSELLAKNDWKKAVEIVNQHEASGDYRYTAKLHERMALYLAQQEGVLAETVLVHIKHAIDAWRALSDERAIKECIAKLRSINAQCAEHAESYWAQQL